MTTHRAFRGICQRFSSLIFFLWPRGLSINGPALILLAIALATTSFAQITPARSADVSEGNVQHVRKSHWSLFKHLGEHILLGVGTYVAVSEVSRAGGDRTPYWPGLLATGLVAALKEGSDAYNGSDTKLEAAFHAGTIFLTSSVVAVIQTQVEENYGNDARARNRMASWTAGRRGVVRLNEPTFRMYFSPHD